MRLKMYLFGYVLVLSLLLGSVPAGASPVILAEDGRAACTIVAGEDDGLSQVYVYDYRPVTHAVDSNVLTESAQDLADHLSEMGMIWRQEEKIEVVSDAAEARTQHRILLGSAAIEEHGLHEEAQTIPYFGYVYRTIGDDLVIFGSTSKGTANGIYGFLQDELGVRWFGPHELFQHVPQQETVEVSGLDKRVIPSFAGLNVKAEYNADHPAYLWQRRRMRMAETLEKGAPFAGTSSHNMRTRALFGGDRYYGEHPEYYALRSGRRMDPTEGRTVVCYSNPDVVDIATEAALTHFRRDEWHHSFSLGIDDGSAYCECDECAELQPDRTFKGGRVASDMYFHFVNEVARRVAEEFPDRYLGVIAYADVTAPPLGEVEENVHVVVVQDISENFDREYRQSNREVSRGWMEKGVTLGFYYYLDLAKLVPAYFPRMLGEELKERHRGGYVHVCPESRHNVFNGPMYYVQSRLLWDIDLDVDELLDEYFTTLYGPAALHMAELFDLFEEIHMRPRSGQMFGEHYSFAQFRPYTGDDLDRINALIAEAHEAVEGLGIREAGPEERRLAYMTNGMRLFLDMLEGYVLAQEIERMSDDPDNMDAMVCLQKIEQVNDILGRHERVYREAIIQDENLGPRSRADTATSVRNSWKSYLSSAVNNVLVALYGEYSEGTARDARVEDRLERAVQDYTRDRLQALLFKVNIGQADLGENLLPNPGFEDVWGEPGREIPEGEEWREDRAYGWGTTPRIHEIGGVIDTVEHDEEHEKFGRRAGRMRNVDGKGYYLNHASGIEGGSAYLCRVNAKLDLSDAMVEAVPRVLMRIWWRGPEGWIRNPAFTAELTETNEWQVLETVALAPEEAHTLSVFLITENLRGEPQVLFDNLSVRLIQE